MGKGKIWFKARKYGWGWAPVTWGGRAVVAVYVIITFVIPLVLLNKHSFKLSWAKFFFPIFTTATAFLILICYLKGEKPSWRWGKKS